MTKNYLLPLLLLGVIGGLIYYSWLSATSHFLSSALSRFHFTTYHAPVSNKSTGSPATSTPPQTNSRPINTGAATPVVSPTIPPVLTPTSSPTANTPLPVAKARWGAYVGSQASEAAALEKLLGQEMDLQAVFVGWGSTSGPFPKELKTVVKDQGRTLVLFWEQYGVTLDQIISGSQDSYIKKFAADAKSYGGPIILAPFHEMNGNWDPWDGAVGSNTPAKLIAAWRHVHDLFSGADNVKFAWNVNNVSEPNTASNAIPLYYPGDEYVDYVSVDGFNFGNPWTSWSATFNSALTQLKTYRKPIYILSMASAEGPNKAAWITDALSVQIPAHPEIEGWVWFNVDKEHDWRLNSDAKSLEAFKAAVAD